MSNNKLLITTGLNTGGAEAMLLKILTQLDTEKRAAYIIVSLLDLGTMGHKIQNLGVPVYCLSMNRLLGLILALWKFLYLCIKYRPSSLVGWMYHGNFFAFIGWMFLLGRPKLIWNVRHSLYDLNKEALGTRLLIKMQAKVSNCADAIVFNSMDALQQHVKIGFLESKCQYIPNGFDCQVFSPQVEQRVLKRQDLHVGVETKLVGMVARNHPMKGYPCFISAMSYVYKAMPNTRFIIAGRGVDTDEGLHQQIAKLGLTENFIVLPEQSDVPILLNAMDIFCLTSEWGEGFPNVVGEALACGTLVVATDIGQTADVLQHYGATVPPSSPQELASHVVSFLSLNQSERVTLQANAVESMKKRYDIAKIAYDYDHVF